jgi:hypothetical protein
MKWKITSRARLDINLIWFGYIARLSQWEGGGYFTRSNDFYLPLLRLEEGGGDQHPVAHTIYILHSGLKALKMYTRQTLTVQGS